MADWCYFEMKVTGKKCDVEEFYEIINADYGAPRHFWRVSECDVYESKEEGDLCSYNIMGSCAWSVYCCMFDEDQTYQRTYPSEGGTTLEIESKRLNLCIEVYSSEPGCKFQEHYVYQFGELVCDETRGYEEYFLRDEELEVDLGEINQKYGTHYTKEDLEGKDYFDVGGFDWDFASYFKLFNTNYVKSTNKI